MTFLSEKNDAAKNDPLQESSKTDEPPLDDSKSIKIIRKLCIFHEHHYHRKVAQTQKPIAKFFACLLVFICHFKVKKQFF